MLRVSADDSRKSEGAFAVRVLLDAGQGGALEERLRRLGGVVDYHDAILIHHQLNLVVLLGAIGLLHVLVDRFLVLSQALFHVFRLQWRAGDGGTQVEDVEAMFRRLRRRLELFRFLLQDVVRRGALDERSDRTHAARAFLPRSRSLRLTGVGTSALPSISGGLELWRNESSEKSFKKN